MTQQQTILEQEQRFKKEFESKAAAATKKPAAKTYYQVLLKNLLPNLQLKLL
jgi:hypothetical protein